MLISKRKIKNQWKRNTSNYVSIFPPKFHNWWRSWIFLKWFLVEKDKNFFLRNRKVVNISIKFSYLLKNSFAYKRKQLLSGQQLILDGFCTNYESRFFQESPHLETSFKDMKKTRNLESYVQWFNRLSYFVATEVCKVHWTKIIGSLFTKKCLNHQYTTHTINDMRVCFIKNCRNAIEISSWKLCFTAREEETARPCGRILDRDCPRVLQHRQFQFPHGDHRWLEHVAHISPEENGELNFTLR